MVFLESDSLYTKENSKTLYKEDEEVVQVFNSGNNTVLLTKSDIYLMSQIVYEESKGEPYEGKVAVASVILNRVTHPSFPKSVENVVKQKNAFSCVINGNITAKPDDSSTKAVMDAILGTDPTNNAVFFYNPKIATSKWMKDVPKTNIKSIGNHVFFDAKK
nr:cell wall hydrolase [Clostridium hydrogeniformans]